MPTAITPAFFNEKLIALHDAVEAGNWALAKKLAAQAKVVRLGMTVETSNPQESARLDSGFEELLKLIASAEVSATKTDPRRFIRTGLSHGR